MNRLISRSRYIYALLSGLPIGIILLLFGIKGVVFSEEDLSLQMGVVKELKIKEDVLLLKLNNYQGYYHTGIPERIKVVTENVQVGDIITLYWKDNRKGFHYIEKIEKDNKVLIEFNKVILVPLISLLFGLIISIAGVIYLVNNITDLFGGDQERMNNFIDPWRKYKT